MEGDTVPARQDHASQGLLHHPHPGSKAGRGSEGNPEAKSSGKCVMMKQVRGQTQKSVLTSGSGSGLAG